MPEKYKRAARKIAASARKRGHSAKTAKRIGYTTATKRKIGGGPCRGKKS
jgi:hypothetical protein